MNTIRRVKNANYTTISNVFLRDERLGLKAKGLMAVIMSLPEDWDFSVKGIASVLREGETSVRAALSELIACSYCEVVQVRENGRFAHTEYVFREEPLEDCGNAEEEQEEPLREAEEPHAENPNAEYRNANKILNKEVKNVYKEKSISEDIDKKKEPARAFRFRDALLELGISEEVADAWIAVRRTKRATNTRIAFEKIRDEIARSGLSAEECARTAVENSWQGFKAEWMNNRSYGQARQSRQEPVDVSGAVDKAAEGALRLLRERAMKRQGSFPGMSDSREVGDAGQEDGVRR